MNDELDFPKDTFRIKEIYKGVFMQEKKHWASGVYAGEKRLEVRNDGSGCVVKGDPAGKGLHTLDLTVLPLVNTYRHYWSQKGKISCFLSYPNGMDMINGYFWEIYCIKGKLFDDIERHMTEKEVEDRIIELLKMDKPGREGV